MKKFSFYKAPISNISPKSEITMEELAGIIRIQYQAETKRLRTTENQKVKSSIKSSIFDYVTFSGTFSKRNQNDLIAHSGYIGIDIDKVEDLETTKIKILSFDKLIPVLVFTSVSGNGLRAVYKIDYKVEEHQIIFSKISEILDYYLSIKVDESGKDIARASFICNDPDVVYNEYLDSENKYDSNYLDSLLKDSFNIKVKKYLESYITNKLSKAIDVTKANTLFRVSVHIGDFVSKGLVDENYFTEFAYKEITKRNLDSDELALKNIKDGIQKGKNASLLTSENILKIIGGDKFAIEDSEKDLHSYSELNSIEFWSRIEKKLPDEVVNYLNQYPTTKEKEIIFLSLLVGASSILSYVEFTYRNKKLFPMLNLFVVGNAGSNKSLMEKGKYIIESLSSYFEEIFPESVGFNVGGNFSYSALAKSLNSNKAHGMIFDSEADILSSNSSKEWGGFSALIRKSFHHEQETILRSGDNPIILKEPKITVLLSGTSNQMLDTFPSTENGFYSRFLFYLTSNESFKWISSDKYNNISDDFLDTLQSKIKEYFIKYNKKRIKIVFTKEQFTFLDTYFNEWSNTLASKIVNFSSSIVVRMAINFLRLSISLHILTKMINNEELNEEEFIPDSIFKIVENMVDSLIRYSLQLSINLKDNAGATEIINIDEMNFIQKIKIMNSDFQRKDILQLAKGYNIKTRKLDVLLNDKRWFYKLKQGWYRAN